MKIVLLDANSLGDDMDYSDLRKLGDTCIYSYTAQEEAGDRIKDAEVVITNKVKIGKKEINSAKKLKLICVTATGSDNIDKRYAKERGIKTANVIGYSTESVAGHTFAMFFYLCKKLYLYKRENSKLGFSIQECYEEILKDNKKIWGIVGMGNIGKRVAELAFNFGFEVICYSTSGNTQNLPYSYVSFSELLKESDVLSVHAPLTDRTRHLFQYQEFCQMKQEAIFLNLGRGDIVVEADLVKALEEAKIKAAGIDVLSQEPIQEDSPYLRLSEKERLFLTPHIGWSSIEARKRVIREICKNIEYYQKGIARNIVEI